MVHLMNWPPLYGQRSGSIGPTPEAITLHNPTPSCWGFFAVNLKLLPAVRVLVVTGSLFNRTLCGIAFVAWFRVLLCFGVAYAPFFGAVAPLGPVMSANHTVPQNPQTRCGWTSWAFQAEPVDRLVARQRVRT